MQAHTRLPALQELFTSHKPIHMMVLPDSDLRTKYSKSFADFFAPDGRLLDMLTKAMVDPHPPSAPAAADLHYILIM